MIPRVNYAPYILRKPNDETLVKCVKCLDEKLPTQYYKHSIRSDGYVRYRQICKDCRKKKEKKSRSRPVHEEIIKINSQECKYCNTKKPLNEFYSNGCFSDGVKKYRTRCKECVLLISKSRHISSYKDKIEKKHSSFKNYISSLLNHCSKRNKDFNIDIQYLLDIYEKQNGMCNISGIKMTYNYGEKNTNISIDRIDSNKGYVKGNINLVCYIVNIMKNQFSLMDLIDFCEKIVYYNKNKNYVQDCCLEKK